MADTAYAKVSSNYNVGRLAILFALLVFGSTILTVNITQATLRPTKTNYYMDAIGKYALIENSCMCHFETDELT